MLKEFLSICELNTITDGVDTVLFPPIVIFVAFNWIYSVYVIFAVRR